MYNRSMTEKLFEGQREGEKLEFIFRRHIMTARKGMGFLVMMIILGIIPMWLWQGDGRMLLVFLGFLMTGLLGYAYTYMMWYFSVYIVTNERIRQVSQKGLFKKTVVDLGLDKIQSISFGVNGIKAGMMGYGTILIQTAVGDLTISMVPKPEAVYNKLQDLVNKSNKRGHGRS